MAILGDHLFLSSQLEEVDHQTPEIHRLPPQSDEFSSTQCWSRGTRTTSRKGLYTFTAVHFPAAEIP
jgi:hypothetical protein